MRQLLLQSTTVGLRVDNRELQQHLEPLGLPERYWRIASQGVWANAMNGMAAMRDYKDYLGPYLASQRIKRKGWALFWFRDVRSDAMPVGRLRSAVEFHQTAAKITHGNPLDTNHGVHLADCDLLLTCDQKFFEALNLVVREGVPGARLGRPVLARCLDVPALYSTRGW